MKLLDVQELDAHLDTLNHQLATMPETLQLKELAERHREVDNAARDHRIEVDDLTREQKRADADVEQVKTRQTRDQNLMDSGQVHNPKDLERMLGEVESLKRRIGSLEDTELEVMERLETAQASLDERTLELAKVDEEITTVTAARDKKAGGLSDALITAANDRKVAATGMPEDLMALYEKLRAQKGGVGAAALLQRRCTGCQLNLNASDLGIIAKRPSDDVVRCEECDRILVRTGESGL